MRPMRQSTSVSRRSARDQKRRPIVSPDRSGDARETGTAGDGTSADMRRLHRRKRFPKSALVFDGKAQRRLIIHRKFLPVDSTFRSRMWEKAIVSTESTVHTHTLTKIYDRGPRSRGATRIRAASLPSWNLLNYNIGRTTCSYTFCLQILESVCRFFFVREEENILRGIYNYCIIQ